MRLREIVTAELEGLGGGELNMLETGTIRGTGQEYAKGDGWSTLGFARHVKKYGGSFVSVDLDVTASKEVLGHEGLLEFVDLREGDTRLVLPKVTAEYEEAGQTLDLVLLDSDNDPDLILEEFLALRPLFREGTVVLVDDVEPGSTGVVKGHLILPYLKAAKYEPQIITREGNGFTTGVLKVVL